MEGHAAKKNKTSGNLQVSERFPKVFVEAGVD
jgi:hypothetical protein